MQTDTNCIKHESIIVWEMFNMGIIKFGFPICCFEYSKLN